MTTYKVRAKRWQSGLELHVEGVGVTQSRGWEDAEAMAVDYISELTGEDPHSVTVEIDTSRT